MTTEVLLDHPKDLFFLMAASQDHGLKFEAKIIEEVARRMGPAGQPPPGIPVDPTARFDLPAWRDPTGAGIPTSIKMTRLTNTIKVDMADARRTVALADFPVWRLLVGLFEQVGSKKVVREIREYLIPGDLWAEITGWVPPNMVAKFHNQIKEGTPEEARAVAAQWRAEMRQYYPSSLKWAAKIDSKKQRRLQCCLPLAELEKLLVDTKEGSIRVYGTADATKRPAHLKPSSSRLWGGLGLELPLEFESPPRARKKAAAPVQNS